VKIYKLVFCDRQRAKFNFFMMTRTSTCESRLSPRGRGEDKGEEFKPIHGRSTLTLPSPKPTPLPSLALRVRLSQRGEKEKRHLARGFALFRLSPCGKGRGLR
jgi:hypothetical protein